jgi:hypothetical protein
MSHIEELVDLPDPAVQPLVHPLDLAQARGPYRTYWLLTALIDPPVGLCVAALLWFATHSPVVPVIAGVAIVVVGSLAKRCCLDQAWGFIPRKRQDTGRPPPVSWALGASVLFAVLLAAGLLLVAVRLAKPDVSADVRDVTFGAGAATGVLVLGELVWKLLQRKEIRRTLLTVPGVLAVVGAVVGGYFILPGIGSWGLVAWGAGGMFVVAAVLLPVTGRFGGR